MNFTLNIIAKTSVILFSAALFSIMLRRASASTRHAVWLLAMVSAALLPLAAIMAPQFEWPVLPEAVTTVTFFFPNAAESEWSSSAVHVAETLRQAGRLWIEPSVL